MYDHALYLKGSRPCSRLLSLHSLLVFYTLFADGFGVGKAGPVGFDPTTTGSGGMCSSLFFAKDDEQHPVLTRRRALVTLTHKALYEGTPDRHNRQGTMDENLPGDE